MQDRTNASYCCQLVAVAWCHTVMVILLHCAADYVKFTYLLVRPLRTSMSSHLISTEANDQELLYCAHFMAHRYHTISQMTSTDCVHRNTEAYMPARAAAAFDKQCILIIRSFECVNGQPVGDRIPLWQTDCKIAQCCRCICRSLMKIADWRGLII